MLWNRKHQNFIVFPSLTNNMIVSIMLSTWCYTSTHANTQHDTWQWSSSWLKITILSPRGKWFQCGGTLPRHSFGPLELCWVVRSSPVPRIVIRSGFDDGDIRRLWIDNLIFKHDTLKWGFVLRVWCWHHHRGTSHAYYLCSGVFTTPTPPKKNIFASHLSLGLSVRESQLFVSVSFS